MLAANVSAADYLLSKKIGLFRNHEKPKEEKKDRFDWFLCVFPSLRVFPAPLCFACLVVLAFPFALCHKVVLVC